MAGWELIVVRHAKAERTGGDDILRPLALRGREQAAQLGRRLRELDVIPELVWCSTSVRTRQTWQLASAKLALPEATEVLYPDWLYYASVVRLFEELTTLDSRLHTVMVVGHEPTVSSLAALVAADTGAPDAVARVQRGVPTGSFTRLALGAPWNELQAGSGELVELFVPQA